MTKVLYVLKVPPPVHGSTLMNQIVQEHVKKKPQNEVFEQSISISTEDIGTITGKKLWRIFKNYIKLTSLLIVHRPALVYFALSPIGAAFLKDAISICIIKMFRIPVIYHLHGKGIKKASKDRFRNFIYNFVFKNQYAITLSNYLNYDIEQYDLKKIYNIGNGIEDINPKIFSKKTNDFILSFLSNYVKEKGVIEFIKLVGELKKRGHNIKAQIIGKPIDFTDEQLKQMIKKEGVDEIIIHQGAAYNEKKLELLANTSIFVFPTYYTNECYPLVLLEAKRFGIPIITSKEGGIRDIVQDGINGFITDPFNISQMADKVELLMNDKNLKNTISKKK